MIPLCLEERIGLIPWSPLARGFLTGNRPRSEAVTTRAKTDDFGRQMYDQEADFAVVDRVTEIAKRRGVSNAQVALAWMLQKPGITAPIVGATKTHHLEDAIKALDLHLTTEELKALEQPYVPHPVLGMRGPRATRSD
jgi:aryl-alcohol dehydrogenase (NADP+)